MIGIFCTISILISKFGALGRCSQNRSYFCTPSVVVFLRPHSGLRGSFQEVENPYVPNQLYQISSPQFMTLKIAVLITKNYAPLPPKKVILAEKQKQMRKCENIKVKPVRLYGSITSMCMISLCWLEILKKTEAIILCIS